MKHRTLSFCLALFSLGLTARGAETFDEALGRVGLEYTERLRQSGLELNATREKIAREKTPLLKQLRAAEDRVLAAEDEVTRLETDRAQARDKRRRLIKEAELLHKNASYLGALSQDSRTAFTNGLAPGELPSIADRLSEFERKASEPDEGIRAQNALDAAEFLLGRVEKSLGGYSAPGSALLDHDNRILKGVFAFMGPETYFRADQSGVAGVVARSLGDATYPVVHPLADWSAADADGFFHGRPGAVPADATGGKALRLKITKGNLWELIQKGGLVAYAIVLVGLLALFLIFQKISDLAQMAVDTPESVQLFLSTVILGPPATVDRALGRLKSVTRELLEAGLRSQDGPKAVLEERLEAVILGLRLHYERRLPLLAVIATAAPLMGLLGTVVGMVRTFALITVFGTGNAGKLASGISEVLITTELGLLVAIPTLVVHGFISHRIQKNLSLLERYALEFVTASQVRPAGAAKAVSP